jgi:hypothetical protein
MENSSDRIDVLEQKAKRCRDDLDRLIRKAEAAIDQPTVEAPPPARSVLRRTLSEPMRVVSEERQGLAVETIPMRRTSSQRAAEACMIQISQQMSNGAQLQPQRINEAPEYLRRLEEDERIVRTIMPHDAATLKAIREMKAAAFTSGSAVSP